MKVETEQLLSIGRFARLTGLTVKALRHYDEQGLLVPARVDEWTGYRSYAPAQARDAIAIRRLRALELPLEEVAAVLHGDDEAVRERLAAHRARLEGRAAEVRQLISALDLLIEGKEPLVQETTIDVRLEQVPALRVAAIGGRVHVDEMFRFVPDTIERLVDWAAERGIECRQTLTLLREPVLGIVNDSLDVQVGIEVPDGVEGDELVLVRTVPAARAAVHVHRGPYEGLQAVYEPLREWILAHGLRPGDETYELHVANPGNTASAEDYLTRVCWPVA